MNQQNDNRVYEGGALRDGKRAPGRKLWDWRIVLPLLATLVFASPITLASVSVSPISWDVVGLNHNRPLTLGPELFPVAARLCNESGAVLSDFDVNFVWPDGEGNNWNDGQPGSGDPFINLRPDSLTTFNVPTLAASDCMDAYFEIRLTRATNAFGKKRPYFIEVRDSDEALLGRTPDFREIYIEELIRQNRNDIESLRYGQQPDGSDWVSIQRGGSLSLVVGETYFFEKNTTTSTGYEQLESFIALSNTLFRIVDVETEYQTLSFGAENRIPDPHSQLYADACVWQSDTQSPNYRSCTTTGKAGGDVRTVYQIEILSGGGSEVTLSTLIYDLSGGSYHYNADFDDPLELRNAVIVDPADAGFSKRFIPGTIPEAGVSTLSFSITNPNAVSVSGYNFVDNLPAGMEVANTPNADTSCGGTWSPTAGATSLAFSGGTIAANGSCTVVVDITTASVGSYQNTSENLFIGDTDSGIHAESTLQVTDGPLPPACVPGEELARWTMDPAQGTAVPPAPFSLSPHVSSAVARFEPSPTLPGVQTISTAFGNPPNSWRGTGWGVATTPATAGPGPNAASYFEFELDSSQFASDPAEPLAISLDINPAPTGEWATPANITANVHASVDGGPFSTIINHNPVERAFWTSLSGNVTPGFATTRFRVNISGRSSGNANAGVQIDNIVFTGCGPADPEDLLEPPTLAKSFGPNPVGVGQASTLTFTLHNPNTGTGELLSGVAFNDELPAGMTVASIPNASTTCAGTPTWAPQAGDGSLSFSDGAITAASTCSAQVDVTSSLAGTSRNISDFIFASESGQNATASGFAQAELEVLSPPTIDKFFEPALVLLGVTADDSATLSFAISNPNPGHAIGNVAFADDLPGGLVVAANANATVSGCGSPSWSPMPGDGLLEFSGGNIAAGDQCTVTVDVTGPAAVYDNLTSAVTHVVGGTVAQGNSAQATLVIDEPIPDVRIRKQVGPGGPIPELDERESDIWPWSDYQALAQNDPLYYLLTIENIGEVPLTGIQVVDSNHAVDLAEDCTWPESVGSLSLADPDDRHIAICLLGPVDAIEGEVVNFVELTSDQASDCDADPTERPGRCSAVYATTGLSIVKSADPATYEEAGDVIEYSFLVNNTGFAVLNGPVRIDDDLVDDENCPALNTTGNLDNFFDPGEQLVCTASYEITPADVSEGSVTNLAFAFTPETNSEIDQATVTLTGTNPLLSVEKFLGSADPDPIEVGSELTYTVAASNIGDVTLNNVIVTDTLIDPPNTTCPTLAVGESCVLTGTYTVTQTDVDAGQIVNTGTADSDETPTSVEDQLTTPVGQNPALDVVKILADSPDPIVEGSVLTYTITAENTGNVTLTNVVVSDPILDPASQACPSVAPGSTCVLTGAYTVTQADVEAGQVVNTGTADSDETGEEQDTITTPVDQDPALTVSKVLTDAPTPVELGSVLEYTITATNNGNVTLVNVLVSDPILDPASQACLSVAPGSTCVLTGSYTVTQADVEAGQVVNTGTADSDETGEEQDSVTTPVEQAPALELIKESDLDDVNGNGFADAGEVIDYTLTATNTGNITLNDVVILDDLLDDTPGGLDCIPVQPAQLAPGEALVCTGSYTVTQADVDAGEAIVNDALASAPDPTEPGQEVSGEDSTGTPVVPAEALLELVKVVTGGDPYASVGDVIDYQLTATNTGNVTLGDVAISDPGAVIGTCVPAQPVELAPGEDLVCEAGYTITQVELDAGSFTNVATVNAVDPNNDPLEYADSATASGTGTSTPALSVIKALTDAPDPVVEGSELTYTVTATNTGNVNLTNVTVSDMLIDPSNITCASLMAGETCVLTGTYTVSQADADAGQVTNMGMADSDQTEAEEDSVVTVVDFAAPPKMEPVAVPLMDRSMMLLLVLLVLLIGIAGSVRTVRSRH